MAKDIIGLDISDASIEAIALEKTRAGFVVSAYSRYRLSPDIVVDGKISKPDKLKEALLDMFKNAQPRPLEPAKVFLSVPESQVYCKILKFPKNIEDKDLHTAALHKAEEVIPEDMDKLLAASRFYPSKNEHKEVLYATAEKETVSAQIKLLQAMSIEVVGLTTEPISAWYGLADKFKNNVTLMLDLGSRLTIASVYDNNGVRESISVKLAGNNIVDALRARFNIDYVQAEEKIRDVGLTAEPGDGEIMLLIQGQLQPLLDELRTFIQYYQADNNKIEQLVLIGGLAQMRGIVNYFGTNLNLPTFIGETFLSNASTEQVAFTKYMNALGLARLFYEKEEINFLSVSNKKLLAIESKNIETKISESVVNDGGAVDQPTSKRQLLKPIKNILSSVYVAIVLVLVGLAGTVYIFREPLKNILIRESIFTFKEETVTVSLEALPNTPNLVYAQSASFTLAQEKDYPNLAYDQVKDKIIADMSGQVLAELNKKYQLAGYYLLPKIVQTDIISEKPNKNEFTPGQPLNIQATFGFLAITDEDVKQTLLKLSSNPDKQKMFTWRIIKADYTVGAYNADNKSLVLSVNMEIKGQK